MAMGGGAGEAPRPGIWSGRGVLRVYSAPGVTLRLCYGHDADGFGISAGPPDETERGVLLLQPIFRAMQVGTIWSGGYRYLTSILLLPPSGCDDPCHERYI